MSEDRFKQARRSLIDRHNQRQQQDQGQGQGDTFDDDFEDEATALVNLDERDRPQFAPPPNFEESPPDEATEMFAVDQNFEAPPPQGGVQMRTHSGVQPSYDNFREDGHQGQQQWNQGQQQQQWEQGNQPSQPQWEQPQQQHWEHGNQPSQPQWEQPQQQQWEQGNQPSQPQWEQPQQQQWDQGGGQAYEPPPTDTGHDISASSGPNPSQSLIIGDSDGAEFDGNTQFVNLSDFAAGKSFTPDNTAAGYEGSTQFVNLNELQAGAAAEAAGQSVESDPVLRQSYQFGPESIQEGEFTLIFAQNAAGRPVVLKRIWEGDPNKMPMPVRQRVAALDQIRHPRLIALNGMVASQSGAWVELNRPPGYRLTDIIQQNGPQAEEAVIAWMKQVAEVLTPIHQQGFVYANLTPDAIWVQDDGTVLLEPFDILAFEHRGNLGAFGPPEMNFPPEQRQLHPATDTFSLAAVTLSALTGLPLNPGAVEMLDKKLSSALLDALQENPQERPQSVHEFAESLDASGGGGLDMKFIIIAVAVLGVAALGTVYYLQQQKKSAPPPAKRVVVAKKAEGDTPDPTVEASPTEGVGEESADETDPAPSVAEGDTTAGDTPAIEQDPRLSIQTSLSINPVPDEEELKEAEVDPEQAAAARAEVREILDGIEDLVPDQQRENYGSAMAKLAEAIRLSGGEPTEEDQQLMKDLFESSTVRKIHKDYFERVNENLHDEKLSRVKSIYPKLAAIDASADEFKFFNENKTVGIKKLERSDSSSKDDEEEDSEE